MKREQAIALVSRAIRSGIFNDLGSGSNVDVCVITKDQTEMLRNYEMPVRSLLFFCRLRFDPSLYPLQNERGNKTREYKFRRGTTAFTKEQIKSLFVKEEVKILPPSLAATTAMDVA
jgi:20S proteasome subunit beta 2